MDMNSALYQIFKNSNPELSDEDIQLAINKAGQAPDSAKQDVGGMLGLSIGAPTAPSVPNSFDVADSTHTITQNGRPDSLPTQNMASTMPIEPPTMPVEPPSSVSNTPAPIVPSEVKKQAAPVPVETPPIIPAEPSDPDAEKRLREADLAAREHKRRMAVLPEAIAGVGDAIASGASSFGVSAPKDKQEKLMELAKKNYDEAGTLFENRLLNDPNSDASKAYRQMVIQIAPDMAKQPSFQTMTAKMIGDKLPLIDTMMKAQAAKDTKEMGLKQLQANKDISLGLKEDQQQDKLEQNAMQKLASLRGDQSLARIENQRDASISAYTLLQQAENEKRPLSQAEYYDVLGQLWKARSGASPTDAAIRDLDSKTFKGNINKAVTYFTGKPAGATTEEVLKNLKQFVKHTGELTDQQHEAYMAPHLIKPTHLKDELWEPIKKTARGMSFSEAVKNVEQKKNKPKLEKDSLGLF